MRELTKSTLSAGLAMSLFGMQTMMNVFRGSRTGAANPAQEGLDTVTQAIVNQTSNTLRETFQVGDKIQREIVDLSFQFLTLAPMRPGGSMSTMSGMTQQATGWLRNLMGGMGGVGSGRRPCSGCSDSVSPKPAMQPGTPPPQTWAEAPQGQGWGPMPIQPSPTVPDPRRR